MKGFRRAHSDRFPAAVGRLPWRISPRPLLAERVQDLPKPTDYVSDFAHVLSPEAIARLDSLCSQLDHSRPMRRSPWSPSTTWMATTRRTMPTSLKTSGRWARKGSDRGLLVLLAVDDHKYRIESGYGLEGILPDGKVGDIGREMVPVSARQRL